jgi:hypothetical protein
LDGSDWIGTKGAAIRPKKYAGDQVRGSAIAGECKSSIHNVISRKKNTGMEWEQGELTKVRTGDEIGPETVRCSEWRTVVAQ